MTKAPPEQERHQPVFTCFPEQKPARKRRPNGVNYVFISLISGKRNQSKDFLQIKKEGRRQNKYFCDMIFTLDTYLENDTKILGSRQVFKLKN